MRVIKSQWVVLSARGWSSQSGYSTSCSTALPPQGLRVHPHPIASAPPTPTRLPAAAGPGNLNLDPPACPSPAAEPPMLRPRSLTLLLALALTPAVAQEPPRTTPLVAPTDPRSPEDE